ncbi:MAG: hypothetical protein ACI82A_001677 [Candidatus Azotimanducaceae bacterium]|jgi:hypothetical protein
MTLSSMLPTEQHGAADQYSMDLATTVSEQASTLPSAMTHVIDDHYGNPANFIQYIIRVPPVHA